jgi:LuxR family maltose regulon positive regulatory protein
MMARLDQARGNSSKSQEALQNAEQLLSEQLLSSRNSLGVKIASARWWITQGNLESATQLLQKLDVTIDSLQSHGEFLHLRAPEYLLLLRRLLALGEFDATLSLGERLLERAQAVQRVRWVIEILVLQALAWQSKKDLAKAMEILERALSLAQPEGYMRVFLDEGEPVVKLLYQAKSHRIGQGYASTLLSALGGPAAMNLPPAQSLIEPLTLREIEVLKLIEAGCSNQEIADQLVISIPTVKRHISNIYAKLGAMSRTQAVSLAKELSLFE